LESYDGPDGAMGFTEEGNLENRADRRP
jgi:hypothetical protein